MKNAYYQAACDVLLAAYGLMAVFGKSVDSTLILCFLLAIAASFGASLPEKRAVSVLISVSYMVLACFMPQALSFLPLVLYEPFRRRAYPVAAVSVLAVAVGFSTAGRLYYLMIGGFFAWLLGIGTFQLATRSQSIIEISDTAEERRMVLEKRNQTLREQQDAEIYTATLRERNRIAREIHDNVGHTLSRCILMTGAMATINTDENLKEPLRQMEEQLNQAMTKIRESVHDLHDDSVDLKEAAEFLVHGFSFCETEFVCSVSRMVPKDVKYCFLSILREALTNVERHSNATRVTVRIVEHPALYQLVIHDNGTTFSPALQKDPIVLSAGEGGMGLKDMHDRVVALNGSISITTDNGFRIFISIPKRMEAEE